MDISHELTRLLNTKETEINVKADIEERQNNFIANVIIEEFVKLKDILDPKNEFNAKTLTARCFEFIDRSLRHSMKRIHYGLGAYSNHDVKRFDLYTLGWVAEGESYIMCTVKGCRVANEYFAIEGRKPQSWYEPIKDISEEELCQK